MTLSETGSFKMSECCGRTGGDSVLRFPRGVNGTKGLGTGHLRAIAVEVSRTLEMPPPSYVGVCDPSGYGTLPVVPNTCTYEL
jgi:hypothetical protein